MSTAGSTGDLLELVVRDAAADPLRAAAAVDELVDLGVAVLAGEYHSIAARSIAARAEKRGVPFLCSSAVLDSLTDTPSYRVARLAPAQSHGWRIYADFLMTACSRIAVATEPSLYWQSGLRIVRDHLTSNGGTVLELDTRVLDPDGVREALADSQATALLLLSGCPEPAASIVATVRGSRRTADVLIGAPAGQPEFTDWVSALGADGAGIPFLRYMPREFRPHGARIATALRERVSQAPSFVAFEGYDTVAVIAAALASRRADRLRAAETWSAVAVDASRGHIRFSRVPESSVWQWAWPPLPNSRPGSG